MKNEILLAVVLAMEGVVGVSLFTLFYQLLKQQGRILLRLDEPGPAHDSRRGCNKRTCRVRASRS